MKKFLLSAIAMGILSTSLLATVPPVIDPMDGRWPPPVVR